MILTTEAIDSPVGPLTLVAEGDDLTGIVWPTEVDEWVPRLREAAERPPGAILRRTIEQLGEYFEGRRTRFDLPLRLAGTTFQRRVWDALLEIPFGELCSYLDVARRIGAPAAVRAVGAAVGRNPVSIVVPCHRVVGSDGRLTGFGGGLPRKRQLLAIEGHGIDRQRVASFSRLQLPLRFEDRH